MPIGSQLLGQLLSHWLTRGQRIEETKSAKEQRGQESALRTLNLEILKKKLAQETELTEYGKTYPTGFEPIPATQEPLSLSPQEQSIQEAQYTPPPEVPIQTKPGYKGMTMKDIGALHQIGLSALPPTEARPRGQVLPTGLLKSVEAPTIHYETVKDEEGNVTGTQVFEGGKPKAQYDITGKEVPLGTVLAPTISQRPRLAPTYEQSEAEAAPAKEGFINQTTPVHDSKGRRLGFETKQIPIPAGEQKGYGTYEQAAREGQKALAVLSQSDPTRYKAHTVVVDQVGANQFRFKITPPSMAAIAVGAVPVGTPEQIESDVRAIMSPTPSLTLDMVSKGGGMGGIGAAYSRELRTKILQRDPNFNFILQDAMVSGTKTALTNLYKIHSISDVARVAAQNHGNTILELAKKKDDLGVPAIDRWFRSGKKAIGGDKDVTNLDLAVHHYDTELARYLSSMTQSGVLSEREAERYRALITGAMKPEQIMGAIDTVNTLMMGKDKAFIASKRRVASSLKNDFGLTNENLKALEEEMPSAPAVGIKKPLGSFWK